MQEVTDGPAVEKLVMQWCHTTMTSKAPVPLGVLVFSGHGEMRDGKQFVRTRSDLSNEGGVDLRTIQAQVY